MANVTTRPAQEEDTRVNRFGLGAPSVLPQNEKATVTDAEFMEHRKKLVGRSKALYWWKSISRVFNMVAAMLIPAAIGLVTGDIVRNGVLTTPIMTAVTVMGGVAAASLVIGIATDYFENLVSQNQGFDVQDLANRRMGTSLARALNEVGQANTAEQAAPCCEKNHAADALKKPRPQARDESWQQSAQADKGTVTINIG